jgi:hypothetical protein
MLEGVCLVNRAPASRPVLKIGAFTECLIGGYGYPYEDYD